MEKECQWLEIIERCVFEENKIVTYKWLSRHLNIHVNISKRLLSTFVNKSNERIGVTYFVGGIMHDGSHRIVVSRQEDLSDVKCKFKNVTSEHVYSIQKNSVSGDLGSALYSVDNIAVHDNQNKSKIGISSIKCTDSILRNPSSVLELKHQALLATKNKSIEFSSKEGIINKMKQVNGSEIKTAQKSDLSIENSVSNVKKTESKSPKKTGGIAAMFAAQKDVKKSENKEKVVKQSPKNKPKGLVAFFNQNSDNKKPPKIVKLSENENEVKNNSSEVNKENNESSKELKLDETVKENSFVTTVIDDSNLKSSKKSKKLSKGAQKSVKKQKKTKEESPPAKKRKRIIMMSDSESSEDEVVNRSPSPEQREPTPPPPVSDDEDIIPATPQLGRKKKKKKLVEKTFLDSDGYLVTNKEYELVSTSEDEENSNNKEKSVKVEENCIKKEKVENGDIEITANQNQKGKVPDEKKKVSPQKVKQASITNFFRKST